MAGVNVKSEILPLKKVLLHRPGRELLNLTPDTLEELLFDDIPFLKVAQEEHDAFAQILRDNGVEVVYLEDLMAEVFTLNPAARKRFLMQWIEEAGIDEKRCQEAIFDYMQNNYPDAKDFVLKTMEGVTLAELNTVAFGLPANSFSECSKMAIAPMPNLYFTRDPFSSIGNGVAINHMHFAVRNRETIYAEYIFSYHPDFMKTTQYYSRYDMPSIEGGDILNLNEHVLAIGVSQRTEPNAVSHIASNIFEDSASLIDTVLTFCIPDARATMHLDTVFTQIDVDKFAIHPNIMNPLTVFEITPQGDGIKIREKNDTLEAILGKYVGCPVEFIPCGGDDGIAAAREQWSDGSNILCTAPGSVVVYERNDITNALLKEKGLTVLEIPSSELSCGRGGPRCMSMPLVREE